jgi:hypothetical protein
MEPVNEEQEIEYVDPWGWDDDEYKLDIQSGMKVKVEELEVA